MQHPEGAAIRRHVDTRLVSYAVALTNDPEVRPALIEATRVCTTAVIQAAGGLVALIRACQGVVNSPYIAHKFNATQRQYFATLFGSLAESLKDSWHKDIGQLMELILLTGAENTDDEDEAHYWMSMAQSLGMDVRPFAIHEDDADEGERVVDDDEPVQPRRTRKRGRSSKEIYQRERLDNLVSRCIALGVIEVKALISNGQVYLVGTDSAKHTKKLAKLRGSLNEAQDVSQDINRELRSFSATEPKARDSLRA